MNTYLPYVTPSVLWGCAFSKLSGNVFKHWTSISAPISDNWEVNSGNLISLDTGTVLWLMISPAKCINVMYFIAIHFSEMLWTHILGWMIRITLHGYTFVNILILTSCGFYFLSHQKKLMTFIIGVVTYLHQRCLA